MTNPMPMPDQAALWNGPAGTAWVEQQALLDALFAPVAEHLADAVGASGARHLLDIGCGTGATTLAAVSRLGQGGTALGVDISAPMIAMARQRAAAVGASVRFAEGDAQSHEFAAGAFDMAISRFGVMFFADGVAAFRHIRTALRRGGLLHAVAWRGPQDNPFMTAAEQAARPLLPAMPARDPDAPGQFSLADPDRVLRLLEDAGWSDETVDPVDFDCSFPAAALPDYVAHLGPVGLMLRDADPDERERVLSATLPAFDRYLDGDVVRFTAACWAIRARH